MNLENIMGYFSRKADNIKVIKFLTHPILSPTTKL